MWAPWEEGGWHLWAPWPQRTHWAWAWALCAQCQHHPPACPRSAFLGHHTVINCCSVASSMGKVSGGLRRKEGRGAKVTEAARMGVGRGLGPQLHQPH